MNKCIGSEQQKKEIEHIHNFSQFQEKYAFMVQVKNKTQQADGICDPGKPPELQDRFLLVGKQIKI
jgi:hypothetical protein